MFTCPACDQPVNQATEVCPYCGTDIATAPPARRREAQRKGLIVTLVGALVLVGAIWGIVWFVLPKPNIAPPAIAEARAMNALREAAAVVNTYNRREGGYPTTIVQVSDQVGQAYDDARRSGYYFVYRPGAPGSDGNIHTFTLLARPNYYGYRNFYIDQTGVIRATHDNRPATTHDPPIS
jgi:hypothetical protein